MLSVVTALKQVGDASVRPGCGNVHGQYLNAVKWVRVKPTIATGILGHVQFFEKTLHQWTRNWCTGDDPSAEVAGIEVRGLGEAQDRFEHGRYAVEGGAFLIGDRVENRLGIERLAGEDDLRPMRNNG